MTITTLAGLRAAYDKMTAYRTTRPGLINGSNSGLNWNSSYKCNGSGAIPVTPPTGAGATCDIATPGAIQFAPAGAGQVMYIIRADVQEYFLTDVGFGAYVYDRLVHTSGVDATVTTPQAINSVALPARAGSGAGVELFLDNYTQTGNGATTFTVTYTNSAGTSGRVSQVTALPSAMRLATCIKVPLQDPDVGVQSVQSITIAAAQASAGNLGITLRQRLLAVVGKTQEPAAQAALSFGHVPIDNAACLEWLFPAANTGDQNNFDATLYMAAG